MSSSKLSLEVRAQDPGAGLSILDHDFNVVGRGIGGLTKQLPPGLYKLRVEMAGAVREGHVALEAGNSRPLSGPVEMSLQRTTIGATVSFSELKFASPIPLEQTSQTHEYHLANASRLSQSKPPALAGHRSVLIFSRAWSTDNRFANWHPLRDLSLHTAGGTLVSRLERDSISDLTLDPWAGTVAQVEPGCYRLRFGAGRVPMEMGLFVPDSWQLQLFLLATTPREPGDGPAVDLGRAAVLLSKRGFNPKDPEWRLTEQARKALSSPRGHIEESDLNQMLYAKFRDPMLGIYGGHLLLRAKRPDRDLLDMVIRNLRGLVGAHPDVEALALASGIPVAHPEVFAHPPMLSASWKAIVKATAKRRDLVPLESYAATAGNRAWTSGGPWHTWSAPAPAVDIALESFTMPEPDSAAEALWTYWIDSFHASWPAEPHRPKATSLALQALIPQLGLPQSVLLSAAETLLAGGPRGSTPADIFAMNAVQMIVEQSR